MYAEIKDDKRLLINRLDNNEAVILQGLVSDLDKKEIQVEKLTGETGEFDGIMLAFKEVNPKEIVPTEDIVTSLEVIKNEETSYVFPVDEDVTILLKLSNYDNIVVTSNNNVITIKSSEVGNNTISYEIKKDGYNSLSGTIDLVTKERTEAIVTINVTPEPDAIKVMDVNDTIINPIDSTNIYSLAEGIYTVKVSKIDYKQVTSEFTVTQEDIDNINKEINIELAELSVDVQYITSDNRVFLTSNNANFIVKESEY